MLLSHFLGLPVGFLYTGSHCVPMCEIISVQEKDDESPSENTGKWQKVPQSPVDSCQHAFTGTTAAYLLPDNSRHGACILSFIYTVAWLSECN